MSESKSETKNEKPRVLHRSGGKLQPDMKPIVIEHKGQKKKNGTKADESQDKYSDGLEDVQVLEGDIMRVAQRAARAFTKGIDAYEEERQKSANEKTDGAIEDFLHNSAKATSVYLKEASEIPLDVAESMNKESYRIRLRKNLHRSSRLIRLFRF